MLIELTNEELEMVSGGEQGISLYWRSYDSFFDVWGGGQDKAAVWTKNQGYLAAVQVAAQNGETITRADFFGY